MFSLEIFNTNYVYKKNKNLQLLQMSICLATINGYNGCLQFLRKKYKARPNQFALLSG